MAAPSAFSPAVAGRPMSNAEDMLDPVTAFPLAPDVDALIDVLKSRNPLTYTRFNVMTLVRTYVATTIQQQHLGGDTVVRDPLYRHIMDAEAVGVLDTVLARAGRLAAWHDAPTGGGVDEAGGEWEEEEEDEENEEDNKDPDANPAQWPASVGDAVARAVRAHEQARLMAMWRQEVTLTLKHACMAVVAAARVVGMNWTHSDALPRLSVNLRNVHLLALRTARVDRMGALATVEAMLLSVEQAPAEVHPDLCAMVRSTTHKILFHTAEAPYRWLHDTIRRVQAGSTGGEDHLEADLAAINLIIIPPGMVAWMPERRHVSRVGASLVVRGSVAPRISRPPAPLFADDTSRDSGTDSLDSPETAHTGGTGDEEDVEEEAGDRANPSSGERGDRSCVDDSTSDSDSEEEIVAARGRRVWRTIVVDDDDEDEDAALTGADSKTAVVEQDTKEAEVGAATMSDEARDPHRLIESMHVVPARAPTPPHDAPRTLPEGVD